MKLLIFAIIILQTSVYASQIKIEVLKDCNLISLDSAIQSSDYLINEGESFHSSPSNCAYWIKLTSSKDWTDKQFLLLGNNINNFENIYFLDSNDNPINDLTIGTDQRNQSNTYIPSFRLKERYKTILIRIKSNSFLKESFRVEDIKTVFYENSIYFILYTSIIAFLLVLIAYLVFLFYKSKSKVILNYTLYIFAVLLATFFISNYGRYFIWNSLPFSNTYLEGAMVLLLVVTYSYFASKVTYLKLWSKVIDHINFWFMIIYPILFFLIILAKNTFLIGLLNKVFPSIQLILLIIMVIQNVYNKNRNSNYFLIGFLFFFSGVILRILINEGVLEHTFLFETIIFSGIILEIVIFSYVVLNYLNLEIIKGKQYELNFLNSLSKINELKQRIDVLNNSKVEPKNRAILLVDATINEVLLTPLSKREIEVLNSIIKGNKYKDISEELYISINTLKTHVSRIYSKLEINNRVEAVNKVSELIQTKK